VNSTERADIDYTERSDTSRWAGRGRLELLGRGDVQVPVYIIVTVVTVSLSSIGPCVVGLAAVMRARREDIPAVVRALTGAVNALGWPTVLAATKKYGCAVS